MQRLNRVFATTAVVSVTGLVLAGFDGQALAQTARSAQFQSAHVLRGSITGVVSDDRGGPLSGAMVSALGITMATTVVTDATGWFVFDALPAGEYTLQAHLKGFAGSPRTTVRVSGLPASLQRLQLRRLETPVATSGATPVAARPIMAAGFGLPVGTLSDQPDTDTTADTAARDDHPHSETAWRLRHIRRSILKDSAPIVTVVERDPEIGSGSLLGRAMESAASFATTLFTDLPFTGEVNLLTTGAFAPGDWLSD